MRRRTLITFTLAGALFSCACSRPTSETNSAEGPSPGTHEEQGPDTYKVRFDTTKGPFVVTVTRAWAPLGADRFYTLVKSGFYDGARFFRVLPKFVVQFGIAGDPAANAKWHNANLVDDPVTQTNRRGTITYGTAGPNTRTTQVFINLADNARLDSKGFAPFGEVTDGMDAVDKFFSEYGEGPPLGGGPSQTRAEAEGTAYFERDFPKLDYVKKASIEK
jgi:cyclophilin family peptidyl-prolyl cis-trans isomerase